MGWTQSDCPKHRSQMTWSDRIGPMAVAAVAAAVANCSTVSDGGRQLEIRT